MTRAGTVRVGDRVRFDGQAWDVGGLDAGTVYLTAQGRKPMAVALSALFADPTFDGETGRRARDLPATFVYAGINVESSGLFTGLRGQQISGRSVLARTGPFPFNDEWKALVATLESALRLHRHSPGSLVGLAKYLHQRTNGSISSLSHLVRQAAITAILFGTEAVDRAMLDATVIDHAAELAAPEPRRLKAGNG